jgi:choline dehydrogenase
LEHIGSDGPLHVSHADLVPELKPFRDALQKAWTSKGLPLTTDVDSGQQDGLFQCISTIYNGQRSTAAVFLEGKDNVTVMCNTYAKHLTFEGKKATGIAVLGPDGRHYTFKAKHEVIVSLGVFESPKLLMLSGIGPEEELNKHGIKPILQSPHVGQNLLDHPILSHVFKLKDGYGLDAHLLRPGPSKDAAVRLYNKNKSGPLSSGLLELVAFPRIDEYLARSKEYVAAKEKNGGVDPYGPGNHFEVDFVPM